MDRIPTKLEIELYTPTLKDKLFYVGCCISLICVAIALLVILKVGET